MSGRATLTVVVAFDDIPGRRILADTFRFDATPEGFDDAVEAVRVAIHEKAALPMRACGEPGPWHTGSET